MAKGAVAKNVVFNKLMEVFPDAFWETENKILRIPLLEDGNEVEIKVSLTCAKDNIGGGQGGGFSSQSNENGAWSNEPSSAQLVQPTEEELQNVRSMMEKLNL